ncbi:MAG TPA: hypothetical protein VFL85_04925 [Candidatus Saccharimonadales bacterium]|nr:hypothetical protein [Candidatus Saccharimonadales bacterium]
MTTPETLLEQVQFKRDFDVDSVVFNRQLGFLQVDEQAAGINVLRLLGFAAPLARTGGFDWGDTVQPITDFQDLPEANRTIDEQGKGVGPRLHNTREGLAGYAKQPPKIGVYGFDIDPERIHDGRAMQGGKWTRIRRHAGRMLRSRFTGVEATVEDVHSSYGDVDGALLELPPLPLLRQRIRGVKNLAGIKPEFIIIRSNEILLHKIGETATFGPK